MIKIKLYELEKHRNECTFRPYLWAQDTLREVGIEFTQGDSYDFAWIAQASFQNKRVELEKSVNTGILKRKEGGKDLYIQNKEYCQNLLGRLLWQDIKPIYK